MKDKGINIYIYGELLLVYVYLKLKEYKYLKGNFGIVW